MGVIAGERAPDFVLSDDTGQLRSLSELLTGGPVVLFFYPIAHSPICTAEACHFRDLGAEFDALGVQRVGISTDTVPRQSRFARQRAFDFPLLSDSRGLVAARFQVRRWGISVLGRLLARRLERRRGQHTPPGWFTRLLLSARRTTFVIDTDHTVLKVISSELRASVHADLTLDFLRRRPPTAPPRPVGSGITRPPTERVRISLADLRGRPQRVRTQNA
jgi:peroxiredoxin Q/BCP